MSTSASRKLLGVSPVHRAPQVEPDHAIYLAVMEVRNRRAELCAQRADWVGREEAAAFFALQQYSKRHNEPQLSREQVRKARINSSGAPNEVSLWATLLGEALRSASLSGETL